MITPEILESAKKYVSTTRLRSFIHKELLKKGIYNPSTNKPYSKEHIYHVLTGKKANVEIENVIISLTQEMRDKRKALEKAYYEDKHETPNT
jgi:hypothetical protein